MKLFKFIVKKLFVLPILTIFLFGCNKKTENVAKINIVSTTFPCYDAVRAVSGDFLKDGTVSLKLLCKPGMEVHSFDPTPQDIISIEKSDLFVFVGGESDEWVYKILSNQDKTENKYLKLFDYVNLLDETEALQNEEEHHHHHSEEAEELNQHERDEHIWTSPENEIKIVESVLSSLLNLVQQKNLENQEKICEILQKNAQNYIQQINSVVEETKNILNNTPEKFIVMADRFPFVYFADFYGINYIAAFSGCSTAVEASTSTIAKLINTIEEKRTPGVFHIELSNHKIADTIAESCGVKSLELHSVQNLSKTDFENGETWVSLMKRNAQNLKLGLKEWL